MTDELDDVQPDDATAEPGVPEPIAQLGIEAQAEYLRARQRLGLTDTTVAQLGTVGRYRLEREVGRGGMGIVYRARDPELDRPVAIKLVQAHPFVHYDKLRARMLREAKVLAKLTHPNVIRIYDFGEHEGEVYLAMEYVEGSTLRQWQRQQTHRVILDAYVRAARGLAAAHELGITHRDFKPDNVLVAEDGRVLVGDFGLAGLSVGEEVRAEPAEPGAAGATASKGPRGIATRTGALLGTLTYMAPEQLRGEGATALSDQFAYCVSLWEALAGRRPFEAETKDALLEQIEQGQVVGAERIARKLRGRLLRGLAVDPAERFGGVEELAEVIRPRPSRVVLVVVLGVVLATGLVMGWFAAGSAPPSTHASVPTVEECAPRENVEDILRMEPQWSSLQIRLDSAGFNDTYERLRYRFTNVNWEPLCPPKTDEDSKILEDLKQRIGLLENVLHEAPSDPPLWLMVEAIDDVLRDRMPPPRLLKADVVDLVEKAHYQLLINELEAALETTTQAMAAQGAEKLELALVYRWRGRILALLGRHVDATVAFREAGKYATEVGYWDELLDIELLLAKTAAMRHGDPERARDFLSRANAFFERGNEPWFSIRRSDYHEILASVLKREGEIGSALAHQWLSILIRLTQDDRRKLGIGFLNLGTIHEQLTDYVDVGLFRMLQTEICWQLAGSSYEHALEILNPLEPSPEWSQAAFNLGRWLAQSGTNEARAIELLDRVREVTQSRTFRTAALTELVLLVVSDTESTKSDALAALPWVRELEAALSNKDQPVIEERRPDAWMAVAFALAMMEDLDAFDTAAKEFSSSLRSVSLQESEVRQEQFNLFAADVMKSFAPARANKLTRATRQ